METIELPVEPRESGTKGLVKRLRREGNVPGVLYGPKLAPVSLVVNKKKLLSAVTHLEGAHLIRMQSDSPLLKEKVALIKKVQLDPLTGGPLHLDFYEVDMTRKVTVRVRLDFVGKAQGVTQGGIVQPIVREVEVECLPTDMPDVLEVDVTLMDIGNSLHLRDLQIPSGVTANGDPNLTVVTLLAPTVVEEAAPAEEVAEPVEGEAPAEEKTEEEIPK